MGTITDELPCHVDAAVAGIVLKGNFAKVPLNGVRPVNGIIPVSGS